MVLAATVATRWFNHRRGLVMGMLAASSATGQLIFLPLIAALTTHYGWRMALVFVCGVLGLTAVVALFFMRTGRAISSCRSMAKPQITPAPPAGTGLVSLLLSPLETCSRMRRGCRSSGCCSATFFVCGSSTNGLIQTHFITLCHDYGLAAVAAASVLAMMGVVRFRRHHRLRLAVRPLRQSLAAVLVLRPARAVAALSAVHRFHVLRPVAVRGVLRPRLDRDRAADGEAHRRPVRPERAGIVFGWIFAGHQLGAASAAFGAGLIRTEYSTYLPAFFVAGALCIVAAVLAISVRKSGPHLRWRRRRRRVEAADGGLIARCAFTQVSAHRRNSWHAMSLS